MNVFHIATSEKDLEFNTVLFRNNILKLKEEIKLKYFDEEIIVLESKKLTQMNVDLLHWLKQTIVGSKKCLVYILKNLIHIFIYIYNIR